MNSASWKVLVTAEPIKTVGEQARQLLLKAGCEIVFAPQFGPLKEEALISALDGMSAVIASHDAYNAAALSSPAASKLKIIARWGVGYDSIDVAAATRNGIVVTYTPGILDDAVADYTFALLLARARRIHEVHAAVLRGDWISRWGDDVGGKTLGIVGFGRIGKAVARRAAGFNMRILVHSAHQQADVAGVEFVSLEKLLAESDFVSLHAALNSTTRGMIGEEQFRQMKPTAHLINTGRGALVDEAALVRALNEHRIAGAALDVYIEEPLPPGHPLLSAPNILFSPHQSSCGRGTGERVSLTAAQSIVDLMRGKKPQLLLNPEVFGSPQLRAAISS
jgi:phosphoglycerate dehydrogenase-like enzyme